MGLSSIKIVVATHKPYQMPADSIYLPLHVGAEAETNGDEKNFGFIKDNTGENISSLNPYFCELTGLYWAWKNLNYDYVGLVHYRRYFSLKKKRKKFDSVLTYDEIAPFLGKIKVFVPKKRKYYVETLFSHYKHTHYEEQLIETKKILEELYPAYLDACEVVFKRRFGYMFNMMIMDQQLLNEYCTWLFDILFTLQVRLDVEDLSDFQKRLYGRVSEILFNVWLEHQIATGEISKSEIMELSYVCIEKVNWVRKVTAFLCAKFFGKKYS